MRVKFQWISINFDVKEGPLSFTELFYQMNVVPRKNERVELRYQDWEDSRRQRYSRYLVEGVVDDVVWRLGEDSSPQVTVRLSVLVHEEVKQ